MRHFFAFLAVCLIVPYAPTILAADGLFSTVPIQSVFASPGAPAAKNPGGERPAVPSLSDGSRKPFAVGQVSELLREAGFETKELADRTFSTKAKAETWAFPVIVAVSDDQKQMWVVLLLSVVKDEKQIPVEKLLALMSANRQYAPAYFSYSTKHKRTELYRSFITQEVTSDLLKDEINHLASIAKETQSLWNFANSDAPPSGLTKAPTTSLVSTPPSPAPGPANPPATSTSAAPTSTLVGKWSASPAEKEAVAMQFDGDGKFVLVHVSQGKQTRSVGKYTLDKQNLTLAGDEGVRLTGTISSQTTEEFSLTLQTKTEKSTVLAFRKAK